MTLYKLCYCVSFCDLFSVEHRVSTQGLSAQRSRGSSDWRGRVVPSGQSRASSVHSQHPRTLTGSGVWFHFASLFILYIVFFVRVNICFLYFSAQADNGQMSTECGELPGSVSQNWSPSGIRFPLVTSSCYYKHYFKPNVCLSDTNPTQICFLLLVLVNMELKSLCSV